jgi:hypothetical protein
VHLVPTQSTKSTGSTPLCACGTRQVLWDNMWTVIGERPKNPSAANVEQRASLGGTNRPVVTKETWCIAVGVVVVAKTAKRSFELKKRKVRLSYFITVGWTRQT